MNNSKLYYTPNSYILKLFAKKTILGNKITHFSIFSTGNYPLCLSLNVRINNWN